MIESGLLRLSLVDLSCQHQPPVDAYDIDDFSATFCIVNGVSPACNAKQTQAIEDAEKTMKPYPVSFRPRFRETKTAAAIPVKVANH